MKTEVGGGETNSTGNTEPPTPLKTRGFEGKKFKTAVQREIQSITACLMLCNFNVTKGGALAIVLQG